MPWTSKPQGTTPAAARHAADDWLLRAVLEQAPEPVVIATLSSSNQAATVVFANAAYFDLVRASAHEVIGHRLDVGRSPSAIPEDDLWMRLSGGEQSRWEGHHVASDGSQRITEWCFSPVRQGAEGRASHVVAMIHDVTSQRMEAERLRFMATHDQLTGLLTRAPFEATLEHLTGRAERGWEGAVALIDVDQFKQINDRFGHLAGDMVLISVADRMRAELRPGDLVARLGGDEFGVLFEDLRLPQALQITERVRESLASRPLAFGERAIEVTISAGLARIDPGVAPGDVIAAADGALYEAKRSGRNGIVAAATPLAPPPPRAGRRGEAGA